MTAYLIIQMIFANGAPYQHIKVYDQYEYLNLQACYEKRNEWRDQWKHKAEIVYLGCLES